MLEIHQRVHTLTLPLLDPIRSRVHFHEFMLEIHKRMHELRVESPDSGDPIGLVAYDIASVTRLLCFDEFQVTLNLTLT